MIEKRLHDWLHVKGIARILNSGAESALVEVTGPRWAVPRLACWTVRHCPYMTVDWNTVLLDRHYTRRGRFTWTVRVYYRRGKDPA